MNHLSPDELIDAVEGTLGPDRQPHLAECAACGGAAARLGLVLRDTRSVAVPEPSPLFWDHFSSRVHAAIAGEASPKKRRAPEWLRWPVLAPIAALAVLVLCIATLMPRQAAAPTNVAAVATTAEPPADLSSFGEQEWAVVSEIVGSVDLDAAHDAGIVQFGDAERAALELSVAEQHELVRLLQEEMEKAGG